AINASIVAARAGEQGKGFSVVAAKVRELAEEIKGLTEEADAGINDVQTGAGRLSNSIQTSQHALNQGFDVVNSTCESFGQITAAAEVAVSVQSEISGVIGASRDEMRGICRFFDRMRSQYQKIVSHLNRASRLGTTKSAMFEDMDNMISQIPHIINDTDAGKN
ncbi:MAG: chemotaxis protein, partial [Lachnospiraceae bacterium]|nr:chemotaxis protein [Lachnospiraceae bacterium]